jgi:hypothetical protein
MFQDVMEARKWNGGPLACGMLGRHVSQTLELPPDLGLNMVTAG